MALFTLLDVSLAFGGPAVLDGVNFQVNPGERLCLVGRNGAGKSTLMKVIVGEMKPDRGQISRQPGAHFARLVQEVPQGMTGTVRDLVEAGLRENNAHEEEWERDVRLDLLLEQAGLDPYAEFSQLSGGLKRRVLLAQALASQPDLLLLDEPTNHLDLASILWLEEFLLKQKVSLFFVTHDRAFLRRLATRIVELDRGVLTNWDCPYDVFLTRRQERLEAEERQREAADKRLAQEEEWSRRKPSAQRKRATARLTRLAALRAERRARREQTGTVNLRVNEALPSGVKVAEVENLSFSYADGRELVRDFSTTIVRGDKIGFIGPNGAGKTTLIKLLLGQLAPTSGTVTSGTNLEVVYFDQFRSAIDDSKTVADNVADGNTHVTIGGRTKHVISYLQDFLFEPERARTPARVLSGGERNRLLLARLFLKPANVLVLDEPTNDLDVETLDLLEDLLVEFPGTVLLVSHDREFLDEVVASTFVFEGDGRIAEYIGGYSDWQSEKEKQATRAAASSTPPAKTSARPAETAPAKKLTNREREELEKLPALIERLEKEQTELAAKLADPALYQDTAKAAEVRGKLDTVQREHAFAFARWEELEARRA